MSDIKTTTATATYDVAADALQVTLIAGVAAAHTGNVGDTLALDYDQDGRLIGIEVLDIRDQPDLPGLLRSYGVDLQTLPVTLIGVGHTADAPQDDEAMRSEIRASYTALEQRLKELRARVEEKLQRPRSQKKLQRPPA
jgi:YD repeat-containing protein